jgi:adiponectin receptor
MAYSFGCCLLSFIPLNKWPRIIASIFALHNETRTCYFPFSTTYHDSRFAIRAQVNIHTHLIPFLLWSGNVILTFCGSSIPSASAIIIDTPILAFTIVSLFTLSTSVLWHTMVGCAHHKGMVICAKVDYIGIAWYVYSQLSSVSVTCFHRRLISTSVATVIHYGFQCNPSARSIFLAMCLINGLAGTIISFWDWFDRNENKVLSSYFSRWYRLTLYLCRSGALFSSSLRRR